MHHNFFNIDLKVLANAKGKKSFLTKTDNKKQLSLEQEKLYS